jgi:hypothetical protein
MKKIGFLLLSFVFSIAAFSQSSLPNGNFEGWYFAPHPTHANQGFYEPHGGFFQTLNILDTIPTPPGLTVYPTDSAHGGTKAARLITKKIAVLDVLIPGVIGTIGINWASLNATLGKPFTWTTKPERFQGYYMSFPLANDSSAAIILLSKWNTANHKRDTIAYTRLVFHGTVSTYTPFDAAIQYRDAVTMPDSITVLLLSCAGYNATFMMASVGQVGSKAYFDDVTITNVAGMNYLLMPEISVKITPNPAHDIIRVDLSEVVSNGTFEVYSTSGKLFRKEPLSGRTLTMSVDGLPNGAWFYKVTDGTKALNSGEFIVSK